MRKQKIELRVILYDGNRYAVYFRASINGMDIYTGSGGIKEGEIFKGSYHASGQKHLKVLGRKVSKDRLPKPDEISGAIRLSAGRVEISTN